MDKERVRRFMDESKRRASFTIDPAQVFAIGSAKIEDATFGKRYIFHDGEIWSIESLDGNVASCCEITVAEAQEALMLNAALRALRLTPEQYAKIIAEGPLAEMEEIGLRPITPDELP